MKRVVLDTNILIPFLQNPEAFASSLLSYDRIVIVPTVAGEYLAGVAATKQGEANRRAFVDFLSNPAVDEQPLRPKQAKSTRRHIGLCGSAALQYRQMTFGLQPPRLQPERISSRETDTSTISKALIL